MSTLHGAGGLTGSRRSTQRRHPGTAVTAADYMSRPYRMYGETLWWAVCGESADGMSGGVIAWCWDEADARQALAAIAAEGQWRNLEIEYLGGSNEQGADR